MPGRENTVLETFMVNLAPGHLHRIDIPDEPAELHTVFPDAEQVHMRDDQPDTGVLISCIIVALAVALVIAGTAAMVIWVRSIPAPVAPPPYPTHQGVLTPPS
jgi:hypothetical protein